jgi:predicted phosphodiesterase
MLRILSDLHLFDGACRIRELRELDPLLEGVDTLLINGDLCDTQVVATADQVAEIKSYFATRVPSVILITGNHDPDISEVHEQLVADGRVWVTHGDVFFPDATPWSAILPEIRRRIAIVRAQDPTVAFDQIETRLRVFRQISHGLPMKWDLRRRDPLTRMRRLLWDLGSPLRVQAVLRAWQSAPHLAAGLAAQQRASAQVVVFGHIHRPSIHHRGGRVIINTGAFAGPLGAWAVDVEEDAIHIHETERRRSTWRIGSQRAALPLTAPSTSKLPTAA